jgi:hypothetical protein
MSLIPSESHSFPDHFTRTVTPSPKPKNEELEAAPLETRQKKPSIVALPSPKPQPAPATSPENSEAVRSKPAVPVPNPVLRRASAPPPQIPEAPVRKIPFQPTLKPKSAGTCAHRRWIRLQSPTTMQSNLPTKRCGRLPKM